MTSALEPLSAFVPILLSLLGGLAVERFGVPRVAAWASRRGWRSLAAVVTALGGNAIVVWATVPALSSAIDRVGIERHVRNDEHVVTLLTIFAAAVVLARLAATAIDELTRRTPLPAATLFRSVASGVVYVVGALIALQSIGISIVPLLETLGVGGLAVALALRDTLANLFAGLQLIASRQVSPGDYVKIDAIEGTIADVNWRNTTVRDLAGALVIVPNEKLAGSVVTNYTMRSEALVIDVPVGVAYESDLEKVERLALDVAYDIAPRAEGADDAQRPYVRFRRFGDARIELSVYFTVAGYADQFALRSMFLKALQAKYRKENVAMMPFAAPAVPVPLKKAPGATRTLYDS